VTDKMPVNLRHLGLIHLLFPKAKLVHCTRDLRDVAVSLYFQYFSEGQEFAQKYLCVQPDEFIVMPNHVHGILFINEMSKLPTAASSVGADLRVRPSKKSLSSPPSLGRIVQWFKTMTTNRYIRGVKTEGWTSFRRRLWQRGYYECVIRNDMELFEKRTYIRESPLRWDQDQENPRNW